VGAGWVAAIAGDGTVWSVRLPPLSEKWEKQLKEMSDADEKRSRDSLWLQPPNAYKVWAAL